MNYPDFVTEARADSAEREARPMTDETDLLPLPDVLPFSAAAARKALQDWCRANVAHFTVARDAEVGALRAELREMRRAMAGEFKRAERLVETLRHLRNHTSVNSHQIELIDDALLPSAPVGVEGFDEWYDSVDARFWNNWDACNAAFHAGKRAALSQQAAAVDGAATNSAVAAIQFALKDTEGMTFLRLWNEGEFDTLRREWPDAPVEVYVGADPLATQPQGAGHDRRN